MNPVNLSDSALYINRELSLLEFNRRVLAQAKRKTYPLLERLRYLCIASSNMDEFFEIRVAGLKQRVEYSSARHGPDALSSEEQLDRIAEIAHELVDDQYVVLNEMLWPELRAEGIYFCRREEWNTEQRKWLQQYFTSELAPILSPMGLDPTHPFPRLLNKSLNFIVTLNGKDAFGRHAGKAIVQAPRALPRVVQLPMEVAVHDHDFVFLSSIIHAHVGALFQGMEVTGCHQFRVTRNSDLWVDEEEITDLRRAVEGELPSRRFGDEVRLEIDSACPESVWQFLSEQFGLTSKDVYLCNGPVNLMRLTGIPERVDRNDLKFAGFSPSIPKRIRRNSDIFSVVRDADVLLHHPFESFVPVIEMLRQAARDPNVLAIRQTLYRTGSDSAVVKALIEAAQNGKEVLVVIELRARFDEADNIELAIELQEAGAQVVYGVVGYKTHSKMILIIRREGDTLRRYVHLGTGNYHPETARLYTDYGLLTCDPDIGDDVHQIFRQLTSTGQPGKLKKLLQSPFTLHDTLCRHIEREIKHQKAGRPAGIVAKMNSLVEPKIIQNLYRASQAGVRIQLVVRGMCCLRPGIEGVSENIEVRSIIGRFLEHDRIFRFINGGEPVTYLSSADWMDRNFFRRVETCFPVEDESLARLAEQSLDMYLHDESQAWILQSDGSYVPLENSESDKDCRNAQESLLVELAD